MRGIARSAVVLAACTANVWCTGVSEDGFTLRDLQVEPSSVELHPGGTAQLTAVGTYSDGVRQDLTWSVSWQSSDEEVATVDDAGVVLGVTWGSEAYVTAAFEGVISNRVTVWVGGDGGEELIVEPVTASICVGDGAEFVARSVYDDGTEVDVTTTATWRSSNPSVATIEDGVATGIAPEETYVTAEFSSVVSNAAVLDVVPVEARGLAISPDSAALATGEQQQLEALLSWSCGREDTDETERVTWTSNTPDVATVGDSRGTKGLVTAVAPGTAVILAELPEPTRATAAVVTVTE
jgi:uncharacterized protein YjdB